MGSWIVPVLAVGAVGAATIGLALLVGRWIDAQSNSVVSEPRKPRKSSGDGEKHHTT